MPIDSKVYAFTKENVDLSPDEAGIYALLLNDFVIYYGEAHDGTIRQRLQRHQSGKEGACTQKATHYKREVCPDPEAREEELLAAFSAPTASCRAATTGRPKNPLAPATQADKGRLPFRNRPLRPPR